MNKNFKEKVQAMSAKEIIMAMVNGLKKQHVNVDMLTFGYVKNGICYGCAATNAICEINGIPFSNSSISEFPDRVKFLFSDIPEDQSTLGYEEFLMKFEVAIDKLRRGRTYEYNQLAKELEIATINNHPFDLPELHTDDYANYLDKYIKYADSQDN